MLGGRGQMIVVQYDRVSWWDIELHTLETALQVGEMAVKQQSQHTKKVLTSLKKTLHFLNDNRFSSYV